MNNDLISRSEIERKIEGCFDAWLTGGDCCACGSEIYTSIIDAITKQPAVAEPVLMAERDEYKRRAEAAGSAEARYPTWQEWHSMNFPNFEDYITPCGFMPRQEVEALMGKSCVDLDCC